MKILVIKTNLICHICKSSSAYKTAWKRFETPTTSSTNNFFTMFGLIFCIKHFFSSSNAFFIYKIDLS